MSYKIIIFFSTLIFFFTPLVSFSQQNENGYEFIVPIPGAEQSAGSNIGEYLKTIFRFSLYAGAVLAILIIVVGGLRFMFSDVVIKKEDAMEQIRSAILGLILLLISAAVLFYINPQLIVLGIPEIEVLPPVEDQSKNQIDCNEISSISFYSDFHPSLSKAEDDSMEQCRNKCTDDSASLCKVTKCIECKNGNYTHVIGTGFRDNTPCSAEEGLDEWYYCVAESGTL